MKFTPTEEQLDGLIRTEKWYRTMNKQVWEISGIAGSGKTTMVYHLINKLGIKLYDVAFVAYVGKATLALCRKGTPAKTIHSFIYELVEEPKRTKDGDIVVDDELGKTVFAPKFVKKESLPKNIKLIVVDEGAMVSKPIADDLKSYGIPIIVLGDRNQLPPVTGESVFLINPDVNLTKPMRQSLDSPIIYLAQRAIEGKTIQYGKYGDTCFVIPKDMVKDSMMLKSDVTICAKNSTREIINNRVRHDILKINTDSPVVGDKMICRQNNWTKCIAENIFLINGLIGYVERIDRESYDTRKLNIDFRPEFLKDECFNNIALDYRYLMAPYEVKRKTPRTFYNKFEYAYAITCHLSQGSEYDSVFVYDERVGTFEYYKQWLYTAITRSSNSLIIAI